MTPASPTVAQLHDSDCAQHNEPAYPNGPCDCSASLAPTAPVEASGSERDEEDNWRDRALSAEASMDAIRRIEDAKAFGALSATDVACYRYPGEDQQALRGAFVDGVMSQSAWSVWLRGPDEVVAAKSYADAVEYCDRLNAEASLVRAVPMPVGVTLRPQPSGETRVGYDRSDVRYGLQLIAAEARADRLAKALKETRNRVREWPIDDHETCMCGSPVASHGMGDGHSPVSQGDHAISMIVEAINEALQQETQP